MPKELTRDQQDTFVELVKDDASREEIAKALGEDPRVISQLIAEIVLGKVGGKMRETVFKRVANSYVAEMAFAPKVTKERKVSKLYRVSAAEKAALESGGQSGEAILESLECQGMCVKFEETTTTQPYHEKLVLRFLDEESKVGGKKKQELMPFNPVHPDTPPV